MPGDLRSPTTRRGSLPGTVAWAVRVEMEKTPWHMGVVYVDLSDLPPLIRPVGL